MDVDFVIAISVFIFIIAFVAIYITNYLSSFQVDVLEYKAKASEIIERVFGEPTEKEVYIDPRLTEKIKRIPIAIREREGYQFINEPIALDIIFDKDCKKIAWNSTIRAYDENLIEIPIKLSYQNFCEDQFLNKSIVTLFSNISGKSIERVFIYFSDNKEILPKSYGDFNLVAYYKLDENYGEIAKDYSGNEFNATLKNDTTSCFNNDCPTWVEGKFGYALQLDGINDYLDCSDLNKDIKTIEFWIKPNDNNSVLLQLSSSVNIIIENSNIKANGFVSPIIYVNGIENESINLNDWNYVLITTNESIEIKDCAIGKVGNEFYNGTIDDIRFWNITKNESYVIARNSSYLDFQIYPEEEIYVVSSRRLNQIRNLSYDYVRGLLELNYRLRLEVSPRD
ncbi:MAG: hypothetical protein QXM64_02520 [Candidatus Aenigmatarchaeota archaeon]